MNITYNPYQTSKAKLNFEEKYNVKSILLEGEWNNNVSEFILKNNILGLFFNFVKGSKATNFDFLENLSHFQLLNIISTPIDNLDKMKYLSELKVLSLQCHIKKRIDFSNLQKLEKCFLYWNKGADSIFKCINIKNLSIDSFKSKYLPQNWRSEKLVQLEIYRSDLIDLKKIKLLRNIRKLTLYDCKKLSDLEDLEFLENLEWLTINGSKKIGNFNAISKLKKLKVLDLSDSGKIPSIEFTQNLINLQSFAFAGSNTYIEDGDLLPLTKLNKLSMLMFAPRKNYSHKLIKDWNWENFDSPDVLLEENRKKPHYA
ncbi:hypothetical protein [Leptospira bandrabouensis]|uniref:hypothetical protein n=1 Tax=Leptospira bandrabouensis TaxID=2484903 RepID=UPI001EE82446|nr:hypothetical protein [Leptospira bandrabouensis]MCG6146617.1 hypothetical protein [Leptospira bandrabouensis]MCG6161942.1 hypothetical protein [Leptospira bandrabouensis]MCG6166196.1 hypothetical protein [Leptospira bandrabouensis]